MPISMHYRDQV